VQGERAGTGAEGPCGIRGDGQPAWRRDQRVRRSRCRACGAESVGGRDAEHDSMVRSPGHAAQRHVR
jgi:hypothetical protein